MKRMWEGCGGLAERLAALAPKSRETRQERVRRQRLRERVNQFWDVLQGGAADGKPQRR